MRVKCLCRNELQHAGCIAIAIVDLRLRIADSKELEVKAMPIFDLRFAFRIPVSGIRNPQSKLVILLCSAG
jgi:hypothetical protein